MNKKDTCRFIIILTMSCLLSSVIIGLFLIDIFARNQYRIQSVLTQQMITKYPNDEKDIVKLVKDSIHSVEYKGDYDRNYLFRYGFRPKDFTLGYRAKSILPAVVCTLVFLFFLFLLIQIHKKNCRQRIRDLTHYLEKINLEKDVTILPDIEDDFAPLQDEIYKTVLKLHQSKEAALEAKRNLAGNLADISHQIKTPITTISIMAQLQKNEFKSDHMEQIQKQTAHMEQLVGGLLTLSRIDAGVLKLESNQVDIYTMLELSVEAIEELIRKKKIQINLPNHPEITFKGDMEWSIEAFINLLKNCTEHTLYGGKISMDYAQNPLYTEIIIKDNGEGFKEKDLPFIFERFYQGEGASEKGIGIGLSLAKSIIEMQKGFISAKNLPGGGACFTIRFYSH